MAQHCDGGGVTRTKVSMRMRPSALGCTVVLALASPVSAAAQAALPSGSGSASSAAGAEPGVTTGGTTDTGTTKPAGAALDDRGGTAPELRRKEEEIKEETRKSICEAAAGCR